MPAFYEFRGIAFGPRLNERQPRVKPGESIYSLRHVPGAGSTRNVLHLGGFGAPTYESEIRLAPADLDTFISYRQTSGTLYLYGVNMGTATLLEATEPHMDPVTQTWRWVQAKWVLGVLA